MNKIKICLINEWESLEEFLKKGLLISRSAIKKSALKKNYLSKPLKVKDEVELPMNLINRGLINPSYEGESVDVLFENNDLWVLNKPHNLHGHPLTYCEADNVLSYLRSKYSSNFLGSFDENMERGLLYRLDQVTSGLLIVAKEKEFAKNIRENFTSVAKKKSYLAIVEGEFNLDGTHSHFFTSKGVKGHQVSVNQIDDGEEGSLAVECLSFNKEKNLSLILVHLKTGLRHQIRAQMASLGFPLLGDELYGGSSEKRVYLHALEYELEIEGELKKWSCDTAPLFESFFDVHSCLKVLPQ